MSQIVVISNFCNHNLTILSLCSSHVIYTGKAFSQASLIKVLHDVEKKKEKKPAKKEKKKEKEKKLKKRKDVKEKNMRKKTEENQSSGGTDNLDRGFASILDCTFEYHRRLNIYYIMSFFLLDIVI